MPKCRNAETAKSLFRSDTTLDGVACVDVLLVEHPEGEVEVREGLPPQLKPLHEVPVRVVVITKYAITDQIQAIFTIGGAVWSTCGSWHQGGGMRGRREGYPRN